MLDFLWTKGLEPPDFPALEGDVSTDVLVIGGGMTGVLCALQLREANIDCILVEGKKIGGGITKGTTAVLTAQHDVLYQDLIKQFGMAKARQYLDANLHAVDRFRVYARDIPCDFEQVPSIMYASTDRTLIEKEVTAVRSLGFSAECLDETPLPFPVAGAVQYPGMAQFHPLKFLYGAAEGLPIFENTFVRKVEGTTAYTDRGTIRAKKVIVATHFPFMNQRGLYFMKLYQQRSCVIALENAPQISCTIMDVEENGMYLRNYDRWLILGGGDSRTGKKGGGFDVLREFAAEYFPQSKEAYIWANQDCVSLDGVPYIGPYSPNLPDVYVATGFNLWGMTSAMVAAEVLADKVQGRENRFAQVFVPDRSMLKGQLFANMGATIANFVIPTKKRCPHMGCALKWNPAEHSWDCPCHGSRFTEHGQLIDNPAMEDIHAE